MNIKKIMKNNYLEIERNFKQLLKDGKEVLLQGATGTGKSYMVENIISDLNLDAGYTSTYAHTDYTLGELCAEYGKEMFDLPELNKEHLFVDGLGNSNIDSQQVPLLYIVIKMRKEKGLKTHLLIWNEDPSSKSEYEMWKETKDYIKLVLTGPSRRKKAELIR